MDKSENSADGDEVAKESVSVKYEPEGDTIKVRKLCLHKFYEVPYTLITPVSVRMYTHEKYKEIFFT